MAGTFHPIQGNNIHTVPFRTQGVSDRDTFVDRNNTGGLESLDERFGITIIE